MGEAWGGVGQAGRISAAALALALAACSQTPLKPSPAHIRAEQAQPEGTIPAPVQLAPALPPPSPAPRAETYSVVVNNVRVQDLLFALARDAKLNVDIHPGITGTVTLNAIDQTLPQLLSRIANQVDMRYEIDGTTLAVMRDTPYLRSYKIDYLSAERNVVMQSTSSTQFAASGAGGAAGGGAAGAIGATGSSAKIDIKSLNQLWESIVQNVKDILRETDKVIPKTTIAGQAQATAAPAVPGGAAPPSAPGAPSAVPAPAPQPIEFIEQASVIGNRESGILYVRATSRQHEKVQEFLDLVMASARRQVLIEATIAEVQLNNQYQRGIDWSRMRTGAAGFLLQQVSAGTPQLPGAFTTTSSFTIGYATPGLNFSSTLTLLETFGTVRVLSSPKLSVLNNQTALLRVTRDIVYFTITPAPTATVVAAGGAVQANPAFTTTPNVAAEGLMMSVLPQINDADAIVLSIRPTIRRQIAFAVDPNPINIAITNADLQNKIPVFETREFESVLRMQSGQTAVLGGLMQDSVRNVEDTIPGVRDIPGLGQLLAQRKDLNQKTELVILLRATVIRDASIEGDYARLRGLVPGADYFLKPNPSRDAPAQ